MSCRIGAVWLLSLWLLQLFVVAWSQQSVRAEVSIGTVGVKQPSRSKPTSGREKILCFIGVQTSYGYGWRRHLLRETWFPSTQEGLDKLKAESSIMLRFVIGWTPKAEDMMSLEDEIQQHGGFMRLAVKEHYSRLTLKTFLFLKAVMMRFLPQYIFKADDDLYLQLHRVPVAIAQWNHMQKDYIGCMMKGSPVITNHSNHPPEYDRWIEPQHSLLGGDKYPTYARGTLYVMSQKVAKWLLHLPDGSLRFWRSEDVTIGVWMAALNASFYEDYRLCSEECNSATIAVYNQACNGICHLPNQLPVLHQQEACRGPADLGPDGFIPTWTPTITFTKLDKFGNDLNINER